MEELGAGWYLFGAQAVQVWGQPRLSADVDVTVLPGELSSATLVERLERGGFDLRVPDVEDFVRRTRVLPFVHRTSRLPLDLVLGGPGPEEEFLSRARKVLVEGVEIPVISPEDLIVTKILASRPKDLEDVRGILRSRGEGLDLGRVRSLLSLLEEALGQSDLLLAFEQQLHTVRRG
jgi:hypothetical protein